MGELRMTVADNEPVLLAEVAAELARGIPGCPSLGSVAAAGWLKQVELEELSELAAFARYKGELGGGPERNNGEAAVLAWVSVNGGVADRRSGRYISRCTDRAGTTCRHGRHLDKNGI